jgi:ParB/RepB/Spo0J family partition protein
LDLEFHQLDLRYEGLRVRRPAQERRLLSSLAQRGQQVPIVVVAAGEPGRFVVIDGFKRLHALRLLHHDTVVATVWAMGEAEALLLDRSLRQAEAETALEQGWLLAELQGSFGLDLERLAERFDRSASWVSRRLGLVERLPAAVQQLVRQGAIGAHAAMKHLLPMARANREACETLAAAIARHKLSTREVGQLWEAWRDGPAALRARLLGDPLLFLRTRRELQNEPPPSASPSEELLKDLDLVGAIARRASRRLAALAGLAPEPREELRRAAEQALADLGRLHKRLSAPQEKEETSNAEPESAHGDPGAERPADRRPPDRPYPEDLAPGRAEGARQRVRRAAQAPAHGASRAVPPEDPGTPCLVRGQPGPSP